MFYNDFILLFIEKYPLKYPLFFLLPPKKPSFADNHNKITARLPTHRIYVCLDNSVLSVGKTFIFLSVLFILLHQDYIKFTARLPKGFMGITTARLRQDCQQIEFTICLDNRVLSVGKNGFISVLTLSKH